MPGPSQDLHNELAAWPVPHVSAMWTGPHQADSFGHLDQVYPLASLTKPLVAMAVLVAVEEASLTLDDPVDIGAMTSADAAPRLATVRQLLSHASGLAPAFDGPHTTPETRRIYSNLGFEVLGSLLEQATGFHTADYVNEAVCLPLGMTSTTLTGSPAAGASGSVNDYHRLAAEMLAPRLVSPETTDAAASPQFASLDGVLPGYGRQSPNPWGLGWELRGTKSPHWTGNDQSPATIGHFGQSGTFCWIDRSRQAMCVVLTDRAFGDWAVQTWAPFNQRVFGAVRANPSH